MQYSNMSKDSAYEVIPKQNNESINLNSIINQPNLTYVIQEHACASITFHQTHADIKSVTLYIHASASCTFEYLMTSETDISFSIQVYLVGEGARVDIKAATMQEEGLYSIDAHIVHQAKHTESNLIIQSMLLSSAKLSFNGTIEIAPDCNKSQAYQKHTTLLLSDYAHVQSVPNLEIHTNDVHCAHASATGQINQEHIVFLGQRGIDVLTARELIVRSFFGSLFEHGNLTNVMDEYFKKALAREYKK